MSNLAVPFLSFTPTLSACVHRGLLIVLSHLSVLSRRVKVSVHSLASLVPSSFNT